MARRFLLVAAVLAALTLPPPVLTGQSSAGQAGATPKPRLTPDGQPDLQGFWTNDTYTPLERPAELAGKEFFTKEEAVAFVKSRDDRLFGQARNDIHYDDAVWQAENYAKEGNRRTSLISDPRDGRLPALTPEGQRRLASQNATQRATSSDRADTRSLAERCITWGNVGPPMMPPTYNANLQILQTRDQVILRHEMMHDVRIVYLDGRPHPARTVQWLAGHSIGHWEGQTLVVDTTNFTARTNFRGSPQNTRQDIFASDALHVVERFTRDSTVRSTSTPATRGTTASPTSCAAPGPRRRSRPVRRRPDRDSRSVEKEAHAQHLRRH
jgi:hypothetical protein